jgi:hypothetical protein
LSHGTFCKIAVGAALLTIGFGSSPSFAGWQEKDGVRWNVIIHWRNTTTTVCFALNASQHPVVLGTFYISPSPTGGGQLVHQKLYIQSLSLS